jgi:hypothetical protein
MREDAGNISNLDRRNGNVIIPDHSLPAAPGFIADSNACPGADPSFPCTHIVTASQADLGPALIHTPRGNWAPRFGFALRPFSGNRTVIRGGFGIYVGTLLGSSAYALTGVHTSDVRQYNNFQSAGVPPSFSFPQVSGGESTGTGSLCCFLNPGLRNPRALQWNVTLEQVLPSNMTARLSYVASATSGLLKYVDLNQIPASALPFARNRTPYPVWTSVQSFENLGFTHYESVQAELTRRFVAGMYFQAGYTLAKELGNASAAFGTADYPFEAPSGSFLIDRYNSRMDRGNFGASRRHRFVMSGLFPLPFRKPQNRVASRIIGGWELSTILLLQSGPFQTPTMSANYDQSNTNLQGRNLPGRPDRIGDGNLDNPTRDRYYDITAFAAPPAGSGRFGNAGAGILEGPGTATLSAGLSKTVVLKERLRMRLEGTFTNLPNHLNFLPPAVNISAPLAFGKLTRVQPAENGNRSGQVSVRLEF